MLLKFVLIVQMFYKLSVAYSSQGSHTGQLDFCNWKVAVRRDNVISITLRHV